MPGESGGWPGDGVKNNRSHIVSELLWSDKLLEWAERMGLSLGHEGCIAPKGKFLSFNPVRCGSSAPE
jgi:hypothetical protein